MHLEARFRIVTPMFLGDANQKATSIRPPSIKGALRFWWRALQWQREFKAAGNDVAEALRNLHKREARLFGLAAKEGGGGQGCFLLSVRQPDDFKVVTDWPQARPLGESGYLAFGIVESGSRVRGNFTEHRAGIDERTEFDVSLRFRPPKEDTSQAKKDLESVRAALIAWGLVGGLGSRARRSNGSVALQSLSPIGTESTEPAPFTFDSWEGYEGAVTRTLGIARGQQSSSPLPPFTAITPHARIARIATGRSARQTHKALAQEYHAYRGQPSDLRGRRKIPFGLPLQKIDDKSRRASPLFFHIHPVGEEFVALALFLPAIFHPKYREGTRPEYFSVVAAFLDHFA